ncbi:MAG: hypothetical protein ACLFTT_11555 [Candidatus Hydrogenedentota bacterium]
MGYAGVAWRPELGLGLAQGAQGGRAAARASQDAGGSPHIVPVDSLGFGDGAHEAIYATNTYQASRLQLGLHAQSMQNSAWTGDGETRAGQHVGFAQLEFSFVEEMRAASLTRFSERTTAVGEGLQGQQHQRFSQASASVAARFKLSVSVSAASLEGFAGAAEGVQDDDALMDRLIALTEQLQTLADEFMEDAFALVGDFFSGTVEGEDFAASIRALLNDLHAGLFGGDSAVGPAPGSATNGAGSQATAQAVQLEFSFRFEGSVTIQQAKVQQGDPIVFDLDGDGVELTHYKDGARFDLMGSGQPVNTAFVTGGDAFLALDRNGDGTINSGKELFGEQHGAANGFEELRKFDDNGDGRIDRHDAVFDALRLWRDNGNGITEAGELLSLANAGIERISLDYRDVNQRAAGGNTIAQVGAFKRVDGTTGTTADALLNYTV